MDMLPIVERPENEQYEVQSQIEILSLLREMIAHHTLATLYYAGTKNFVLTTVLSVDPEQEEIVLDAASDPRDNDALLASERITIVSLLDHVKVQFHASHAERVSYEDGDAIRIRMPESMLRLQRRNYYRIETPVVRPLEIVVPANVLGPKPVTLRVVDLSCGGVGVVYQPPIVLEMGAVLANCRLELPDAGALVATLEVRFQARGTGPGGTERTRCGMQFLNLPTGGMTMLQRYINKLERERRSKA